MSSSYLGRSASLGRKKDPFAYREGDVESGFGGGDVADGTGAVTGGAQAGWGYYPQAPGIVTRQPHQTASDQHSDGPHQYIAPPTASSGQWTEYRRPSQMRMASSSSFASKGSDALSPYPELPQIETQPQSPMLNPYSVSPTTNNPAWSTSPNIPPPSPRTWASPNLAPATHNRPQASPVGGRPPPTPSSRPNPSIAVQNHAPHTYAQTGHYPASQPVTPAGKYDMTMPPPRIAPSRDGSTGSSRSGSSGPYGAAGYGAVGGASAGSKDGFSNIRTWTDLRPVINSHPNGRRADPDQPGKYLSPLKCLTTALPQTYSLSSPNFRYVTSDNPRRVLTKPSKPSHNDGADNEDWDYILYVNDVLGGEDGRDRYLILDVLGQGTFGQVVKCQNMRTHELCAVKVVKNKPAYLQQSKMEVAILELLNTQHDPQDQHHILRLYDSFTHKHHLCLVFECLSSNLYELIKQNQFKGLSTQLVKVFTQQLLDCMAVLKDARLIHCDLKPENILLKSLQSPQIKVIDFGSACHEMQTVYTYIQSRFYRSPEVLFGLPYSTSIDMWSLGCIVVELFLGLPLFPGTSEYNQVTRIVDMLGNPPTHLLEVGKQTHEFFNSSTDSYGRKKYTLKSLQQYSLEHRTDEQPSKQYFKQTKLRDVIMEYPVGKKKGGDVEKEMATRRAFVDFAEGLLSMDPIKRWSPQQAMKHPFITGEKFMGAWQPDSTSSSSKKAVSPGAIPSVVESTTSTPSKKYGGLVQTPPSSTASAQRTQRIYSDISPGYSLTQSQSHPISSQNVAQGQVHTQASGASAQQRASFSGYELSPGGYTPSHQRVVSQQLPSAHAYQQHPQRGSVGGWGMSSTGSGGTYASQGQQGQARAPSLNGSTSHANLRPQPPPSGPPGNVPPNPNPPPNSYYPSSRTRANTINQMDTIPPALARLVHFGVQDPSGGRNTLTPVLNRDEAIQEWERRYASGAGAGGGGHAKQNSVSGGYPQLEYLQEQAEMAAMQNGRWMVPAGYGHGQQHQHRPSHLSQTHHAGPGQHQHHVQGHNLCQGPQSHHSHGQSQGHRTNPSGNYAMQVQPHIGISPPNPADYRPRPTSEYDPPLSSTSSSSAAAGRGYGPPLPTYPPLAATTSHPLQHAHSHQLPLAPSHNPSLGHNRTQSSQPNSATSQVFDPFDGRDGGMGMMYTPLQPQVYGYPSPGTGNSQGQAQGPGQGGGGGGQGGHGARASYSGPYGSANPFAGAGSSPRY